MKSATVQNESWTLTVLPELGASILNLQAASGRPVMRPVDPASVTASSASASFALLPYSNRIREARFEFGGRAVQLRPGPGGHNVQHGDVRNRPWQVTQSAETALSCAFDSRNFGDINWPWAFTAQLDYRLHGPHFDIAVTLTNVDQVDMPAGMGLHPYFQRLQGAQEPTVQFNAGGWYQADASNIPVDGAQNVPPELEFAQPRPIGPDHLDAVFASWDGTARLAWEERALTITADNVFSHLVIFTAPDGSLAIEPVSHATDAFNLSARGVLGTDMKVLSPGQSLAGAVRLTLEGAW
ncbi:aldose 1-epimerase [Deinococcus sp.]|uniref:aldose 1-epimerase n=1 Tax=Deinococcus sp. TaxID=47478 RepID=UPI0025EE7A70|nr:aldose 1-epimerase [Deinococcus sp.]